MSGLRNKGRGLKMNCFLFRVIWLEKDMCRVDLQEQGWTALLQSGGYKGASSHRGRVNDAPTPESRLSLVLEVSVSFRDTPSLSPSLGVVTEVPSKSSVI